MDDKRSGRLVGSKVSQIANIFQSMAPGKEEGVLLVGGTRTPDSPKLTRKEDPFRDLHKEPTTVTVVRTESHVARFNNARAMFEKLGEENQKVHLRSPVSNAPKSLTDRRSRSSSANSSDGNSTSPSRNKQISSRSPSPSYKPNRNSLTNGHDSSDNVGNNKLTSRLESVRQNCVSHEGKDKENECVIADPTTNNTVKRNIWDYAKMIEKPERQEKPDKPEKPEKPERKINNLIEKQRNWPSHFSNRRSFPKTNSGGGVIRAESKNNSGDVNTFGNNKVSSVLDKSGKVGCDTTFLFSGKSNSPVSPTSHVPYISPSPSMVVSQEEKQEKEIQEKVSFIGKFHFRLPYNDYH
ncbi:hypothetical protein RUM43_013487 [Polyplax serrata]|uniref:Uncharacterized protein n=1 Tax=Polyplax serrata TaxID=468196 RepID=A0AAN8P573_POLSC